ncbi:MAG: signal recognition particle protein, partial [Armatimonadetes bacterium]|nr:signal recognition particle protein [Armatimonadota bacterium]
VDAMTGQDAVAIAQQFSDRVGIDGVILTKLDGDARGGAALSVKAVTGKPIKFVGTGEKLAALELFYPDRMASRILGMGDILSLVEKVEASVSEQKALELEKKLRDQDFGLGDFLDQLREVRKIGPVDQLLAMIPGLSQARQLKGISVDERQLGRTEAIICSMTLKERSNPALINAGRRRRIAQGSGTSVADVNRLLKQFYEAKKLFKQIGELEKGKNRGKIRIPFA